MNARTLLVAALLALATLLVGCQKEEGPMEKMGKKLDHATEEVKGKSHSMSDDVKDAAHDAKEAIEDAAKDVEKAVEGDS